MSILHSAFASFVRLCRDLSGLYGAADDRAPRQSMTAIRRSVVTPLACALVLLANLSLPAHAAQLDESYHVNALWVGQDDGVLKVATSDGEVLFEVADAGKVDAVAVDERSGMLWAVAGTKLTAYTPTGAEAVSVTLPGKNSDSNHLALATDGSDGSLWLGRGQSLWRIAADGTVGKAIDLGSTVRAIALDPNRGELWVAAVGALQAYGESGEVVRAIALPKGQSADSIAFDDSLNALWVADTHNLYRYGIDGARQYQGQLRDIRLLASDRHGGLWVATEKQLFNFDAAGTERFELEPFQGQSGSLVAIAADPADSSAWVASESAIAQVAVDGTISHTLDDGSGQGRLRALALYADTIPPELTVDAPTEGAYLSNKQPTLKFTYSDVGTGVDKATLAVSSDNASLAVNCTARDDGADCVPNAPLPEGEADLSATVKDRAGNSSDPATRSFTVDTIPPTITVDSPANGAYVNVAAQTIAGQVSEPADVSIDGASVALSTDNRFSRPVVLAEGGNTIQITAQDRAGNAGSYSLALILDTVPPAAPAAGAISIDYDADSATVTGAAGSVEAGARVVVKNLRTGQTVTVLAGADGSFSLSIAAQQGDALSIIVVDAAGNSSGATNVSVPSNAPPAPNSGFVPADPASIAPPLDPTVPTTTFAATSFLYSGSHPIQFGVAEGIIEEKRVAVLRGLVSDRNGTPLSGVTVTILNHPEFGWTGTRQDGAFDIAVNGGGALTVMYEKSGYLPVQRKVDTPWQDYVSVPSVALIPLDSQVTAVTLGTDTSIQVARGSVVTDNDGTRQATIMFQPDTQAQMVLADGTTVPLTTLHVRATEYTAGDYGPAAMPGTLPPTSAYTYAAELSVDEAIAVGAKEVSFNKPAAVYVDNFVDFPVGEIIPAGWFDRNKDAWIPSDDGYVIAITGVENGVASLDVTGQGVADESLLDSLGITIDERRKLAQLYQPGKSLWRVPVTHFTPWDFNKPWGLPDGATSPDSDSESQPTVPSPSPECGSIIECENQVLGESIPIYGTQFTLNYRSSRVDGFMANRQIRLRITGSVVPNVLKSVVVKVSVAGQHFYKSFMPAANQHFVFTWNGLDGYGRPARGRQVAKVEVGYVYQAIYYENKTNGLQDFIRSFGQAGNSPITLGTGINVGVRGGGGSLGGGGGDGGSGIEPPPPPIVIWKNFRLEVGHAGPDFREYGIGGWSLNAQHAYDPLSYELLLGNGQIWPAVIGERAYDTIHFDTVITRTGSQLSYSSWGGTFRAIATGPDGTLYLSNGGTIFRYEGDGVVRAILSNVSATMLTAGPGGELYFGFGGTGAGTGSIKRMDIGGKYTSIAGGGAYGQPIGNGVPATQARITPNAFDFGPDGSLYISDQYCIRRVGPDGIIWTIAGVCGVWNNPVSAYVTDDGKPAIEARNISPNGLAVGKDGTVYFVDTYRSSIRTINPAGTISTFVKGFAGNISLGFDQDGALLATELNSNRVRKVDAKGEVSVVFGTSDSSVDPGDAGAPTLAHLGSPWKMAVAPDGTWYLPDTLHRRILRVDAQPASSVVSRDGSELYAFDSGRHVLTRDTSTGVNKFALHYENGRLDHVLDAYGNETIVERDGDGHATAIVASNGQRTSFSYDSNGYLSDIAYQDGSGYRVEYTSGGLLEYFESPRGYASHMTYDDEGRLISDTNAGGGGWNLSRLSSDDGFAVVLKSAEGRSKVRAINQSANGVTVRSLREPDGTSFTTWIQPTGDTQTTEADGTIVSTHYMPDSRFSLHAPVEADTVLKTPGGKVLQRHEQRTVTLSNSDDPLSVMELSRSVTINGRNMTANYTAVDRFWRFTLPSGRNGAARLNEQGDVVASGGYGLADISYSYDDRGRLTGVSQGTGDNLRTVNYAYDTSGYLSAVRDGLGRDTRFEHDLLGRVTEQRFPDGRVVKYSYDRSGNLTSLVPPGRDAHLFTYTPIDLQEQYMPPELSGVQTVTHYSYNRDKDLTRIDRPDGKSVAFDYDAGGHLSAMHIERGQYSYGYSPTTGQLTQITAPDGGQLSYTYDGFLPLSERWSGGVSGVVDLTYDNNFWVTKQCISGISCAAYGYDADGLTTQAGGMGLTRDAQNGLLTGTALGNVTTAQAYNAFGEPITYSAQANGSALYSAAYTRDKLGRITSKTETVDGHAVSESYEYDLAGRLSKVMQGAAVTTYTYDENGNRQAINGVVVATYDGQDRLNTYDAQGCANAAGAGCAGAAGGASYTYTANGELKTKFQGGATTTYDYDELGNLLKVTLPGDVNIEYLIDGRNRRIGKKVNGQLVQAFLYQGQLNPVAELDGSGNVVARFVYGDKANVPSYMETGGKTYRIISDHLGSPRLVIDTSTGEVAQRMDYDVWGNVTSDTNPGFQPFGFAGGIYDQQTGLTRFGARDYDAWTGRWTAKDPIGFAGGDTDLYAYSFSNPIMYFDADGRRVVTDAAANNPSSTLPGGYSQVASGHDDVTHTKVDIYYNFSTGKWVIYDPVTGGTAMAHPGPDGFMSVDAPVDLGGHGLAPVTPSEPNNGDYRQDTTTINIDGQNAASSGKCD